MQHLKGWAEKFLPQIEQGRQQQLEQIGGQLTEAAAHEQAHDYAAGLRVLEKVPEILREAQVSGHSDTVSGVMSRLQSTLDEIKRLDGGDPSACGSKKAQRPVESGESAAGASAGSQGYSGTENQVGGP